MKLNSLIIPSTKLEKIFYSTLKTYKKVDLYIVSEKKHGISKMSTYIKKLANVGEIAFINSKDELDMKVASNVLDKTEIYIPLGELVDFNKEIIRLKGELDKIESEIQRASGKLSNQGFIGKAPKALVDAEREKLDKFIEMRKKLILNIKNLEEN